MDDALEYHEAALAIGTLNAEAFAATSHTMLLKALEMMQKGASEATSNAGTGASSAKRAARACGDPKIAASDLVSRAFSLLQKVRNSFYKADVITTFRLDYTRKMYISTVIFTVYCSSILIKNIVL